MCYLYGSANYHSGAVYGDPFKLFLDSISVFSRGLILQPFRRLCHNSNNGFKTRTNRVKVKLLMTLLNGTAELHAIVRLYHPLDLCLLGPISKLFK